MPARRFKSRTPMDWVYRDSLFDDTGALVENQGSYTGETSNLATGAGAALIKVLYDSHNYVSSLVNLNNLPVFMGSSARAEGGTAKIIRVQGLINVKPNDWVVGSQLHVGFRFGVWEQDVVAGGILLDPTYTMWASIAPNPQVRPAMWANNRNFQREVRFLRTFSDNGTSWQLHFNFPVNRRLKPHECYGVYCESPAGNLGSVGATLQFWLRTLVSDEGA